jgi:hypothetical protein
LVRNVCRTLTIARNVKTASTPLHCIVRSPPVIRRVLLACLVLVPTIASAHTASGTGAPVVFFFSIFGPNGSELQRFYADVFDWKVAANGDVATTSSTWA